MPRLSAPLWVKKPLKKFNNYKPRTETYRVPLPPILADAVSNKKDRKSATECLQEMTMMMACWKDKEFSQERCSKEIDAFSKCATAAAASAAKKRDMESKGLYSTDGGRLPSERVNRLLGRFPQPPHRYS